MSDLIEAMARIIDPTAFQLADELERTKDARHILTGESVPDDMRQQATALAEAQIVKARGKATAALAALRETHHLVPKDQEPVALMHDHIDGDREFVAYRKAAGRITEGDRKAGWEETDLYALAQCHADCGHGDA